MKILKPNIDEKFVPIAIHHIYVTISDYGAREFLKEIIIGPGQHSWEWINFKTTHSVNISNINDNYCSFDNAINRAVNSPYMTVYEFEDFEEVSKCWGEIKYIDNITTIYKSKEE